MTKYFPLSHLPRRKFELGDRVENTFQEGIDDPNYCFEATVIGYYYNHPLWLDDSSHPGWIYTVLKTHDSDRFSGPFVTHFHEDEIALVTGFEHTWLHLNQHMKARLFGFLQPLCSILQSCVMRVEGTSDKVEIQIECPKNTNLAAELWQQQSVLRAALKAWGLPASVTIFHDGQVTRLLQCSFEILPTIKIPVTMSENNPIIQRANRHKSLIRAIGASAVAVSLHDANEFTSFQFLDLYAGDVRRLNKPREAVIGQPASIIDPRISEPRIHHIKRAIANGQHETFTYIYEDEYIWKFQCSVAPVYGTEEVIVVTSDMEEWQRHHWSNKLRLN